MKDLEDLDNRIEKVQKEFMESWILFREISNVIDEEVFKAVKKNNLKSQNTIKHKMDIFVRLTRYMKQTIKELYNLSREKENIEYMNKRG